MHRLSFLAVLALVACAPESPPKPVAKLSAPASAPPSSAPSSQPDFKMIEHPADEPMVITQDKESIYLRFARTYSKKLLDGYTIKLHTNRFFGDLNEDGEVDQMDEKWALFNPSKPAEHIFNATVIEDIKREMPALRKADRDWWASTTHNCFVDQHNKMWCQQP